MDLIEQLFSSERDQKILREAMAGLDMSAEATVRYFCRMGQTVHHQIQQGYKLAWVKDGEIVDPLGSKMAPMPAPTVRSCNRHDDCDKAEEEVMARRGIARSEIHTSFHCHDDECEDCFGS